MQKDRNVEPCSKGADGSDVVKVCVCQPDGAEPDIGLLHRFNEPVPIFAGVHHRGVATHAIDDEVRILLQWPRLESDNIQRIGHAG